MINFLKKLVIVFGLLSFLTLAVTGFVPYFFLGGLVTGYWLMLHVTAGGVFAACAAGLAVLFAERKEGPAARVCFWIILTLSPLVILSAGFGMFRFFGTDWQKILLLIHLYSTLGLSLFAIVYLYLLAISKTEKNVTK
jgi:hypothetical protein